ncbi:hypothetical protein ACFSJY_17145 [Thalassotalea euphylliae]|uniref:hypothetical protein n=1 Tax=Thalassotalea euphylliae TaxID=1655234 RepID=UPI003631CCF5
MAATPLQQPQQERRHSSPDRQLLLSRLSISQKYSVNSLSQYGYNFAFVRGADSTSLAVLTSDGHVATVNSQGEIDTDPSIIIRR